MKRTATTEAIAAMKASRARRIAELVHSTALKHLAATPVHLQTRHDAQGKHRV